MGGRTKNKENQFIDFRLLTTKKEKPRFFLLCQQSDDGLEAIVFNGMTLAYYDRKAQCIIRSYSSAARRKTQTSSGSTTGR
ncbi:MULTISPECIES: hypothetical protein [Enterobacterales]|uniref:hypothetical protein n=1 Tax=Enterobacterales TaxID=91347 RepID=UPI002ED923FA